MSSTSAKISDATLISLLREALSMAEAEIARLRRQLRDQQESASALAGTLAEVDRERLAVEQRAADLQARLDASRQSRHDLANSVQPMVSELEAAQKVVILARRSYRCGYMLKGLSEAIEDYDTIVEALQTAAPPETR